MELRQVSNHHPTPGHQHWLSRNRLLAANGVFTVYAIALAVDTGHADRTWAIWAAVGYGVTTLIIWLTRHKNVPVIWPMLVSLAGALAAPVTWRRVMVDDLPEFHCAGTHPFTRSSPVYSAKAVKTGRTAPESR